MYIIIIIIMWQLTHDVAAGPDDDSHDCWNVASRHELMQHILRLRLKHEMADLKNLDQRGESTHHVCGGGVHVF